MFLLFTIYSEGEGNLSIEKQWQSGIWRKIQVLFFYVLIVFIIFFHLGPFLWQVISSLKNASEIYSLPIKYFPSRISLDAYEYLMTDSVFLKNFFNSITVSLATTLICLIFATVSAYSLSRLNLKFKNVLQLLLLLVCLFPQIIFLVPLYEFMAKFNFIDKPLALVLPYVTFSLPLAIWIMAGFFQTIPKELEEQAMIDGFSRIKILWKIILPLSWPALATCAILIFIGPFAWNEFLFALSFMTKDVSRTVPVGIALLSGASMYEVPWSRICAACVLATLPLIIFVVLFQRKIITGLTRGAVKG